VSTFGSPYGPPVYRGDPESLLETATGETLSHRRFRRGEVLSPPNPLSLELYFRRIGCGPLLIVWLSDSWIRPSPTGDLFK
jgi:hypothetical protein